MQLCNQNLNQLPATVQRPRYDRSQVVPAIVHLGVGAFHRAHQAVMTEAVLASGDLAWGIVGAGLMTSGTKDALAPQDGLYTLVIRSEGAEQLQVVGAITELLGGAADLSQVLARMCAPSTRIVSLTVTEKGYYLDPASGKLQLQAPAIQADLATPGAPRTILGLIVQALKHRKANGIAPFTVLSCDNLPSNGKTAKAAVLAFAREVDAELASWIEAGVSFPCSMVDRITPATTDADRAYVNDQLGMRDAWPIVTEGFVQWVIEDNFTMGRPDWTLGGAVFSNEIEAWENMKLRCLNGAHSTLAYLGQLTGRETVNEAMQLPLITGILDALWAEVLQVLHAPAGVDPRDYVEQLKKRFCNPALKHRTAQIAMDGSQKLPQRLLATLRERMAAGLPSPALATAIAAWMHFAVKTAHTPGAVLNDPLSADILAQASVSNDSTAIIDNLLGIDKIFGSDLKTHDGFKAELLDALRRLAAQPQVAAASQIAL
ncbi:mannitol dehydrogenase family protein [Rhodoferax sp.]|uniref:mannitol dehydrogenase family protein n=1 Tax=Rhodoferax sp. TaxID=50421 RepID=UPI002728179B|nr:mannitol dehydrogenase family protein [Rhodoferax sp.]MDO9144752.1 mannitol dehydrogenase family protein [Rhodoferax sp.]